jgi:hypothetical protein
LQNQRTLEQQKEKSADTNLLDRFCRSEELNDFAAMAKALCPFFSNAFTSIPRRNSRANLELQQNGKINHSKQQHTKEQDSSSRGWKKKTKTRTMKRRELTEKFFGAQSSEHRSRKEAAKIKQEAPNDPSVKKWPNHSKLQHNSALCATSAAHLPPLPSTLEVKN